MWARVILRLRGNGNEVKFQSQLRWGGTIYKAKWNSVEGDGFAPRKQHVVCLSCFHIV